ncbi:MAG: DUF6496 domain-containing protein [Anaeromyxobacter sp.]
MPGRILAEGKRPTTAAGEFVKEEMEHVKRGKHGVRSRKQAIAIGLSKARRSGVPLPPRGKAAAGARRRPAAAAARTAGGRKKATRSSTSRRGAKKR